MYRQLARDCHMVVLCVEIMPTEGFHLTCCTLRVTWLSVEARATAEARAPRTLILILTGHAGPAQHTALATPAVTVLCHLHCPSIITNKL